MEEEITLNFDGKQVKLPLKNFLRITFFHLIRLLPEYYAEKKSDSLKDFIKWTENKLGLGKGKSLLL